MKTQQHKSNKPRSMGRAVTYGACSFLELAGREACKFVDEAIRPPKKKRPNHKNRRKPRRGW